MQDLAGEIEEARRSFETGLRLNPGYAQLYHAWARLEGRLGNWGGLNEINKRAQAAFPSATIEQEEPATLGTTTAAQLTTLMVEQPEEEMHAAEEEMHAHAPEEPPHALDDDSEG